MKKSDQDIIAEAIGSPLREDEMWDDGRHGEALAKTEKLAFQARQKASSEKIASQKKELKIENPNSSGQGPTSLHSKHRFHDLLTQQGYEYSHTTPVIDSSETVAGHHTYTHQNSLMPKVSVVVHPKLGDSWGARKGLKTQSTKMGNTAGELEGYLNSARKRAKS
jgi:hypothetical protein